VVSINWHGTNLKNAQQKLPVFEKSLSALVEPGVKPIAELS
jgi:hypothetical protein